MGAMEVLDYNNILGKRRDRDYEFQEAARMGIENARRLLQSLTQVQPPSPEDHQECDVMAGAAISKFQKVVSLLSRTGHARFRRRTRSPATAAGYGCVFLESSNFEKGNNELKKREISFPSSSSRPPSPPQPKQQQQQLVQQVRSFLLSPKRVFHIYFFRNQDYSHVISLCIVELHEQMAIAIAATVRSR